MAFDKNSVIKEAQKFSAKGQFDKAIAEWKKIAKETPKDANIFNTIGDLCLKKNSKHEAVEAYQKAADILASDGFTSKAIALYKKVLNIDPKKIEAHLALADLNAEKGLTGNALESYKIVADHYTQHKETRKALGIYQKMADMNPSNAGFRLKLADMYAKEGMKPEAVKAYLAAADAHVAKNAFTEARQLFEKALAVDPNNKDVYHKAGLVYFKEGKFVEACKALKPAFEHDPSNQELGDLYFDAMTKAGRTDEVAEAYGKLLEQQPDRVDLHEKLYRLLLSQKEYDKAFSEASSLTNIKIENKDFEGAEALLKEFLNEAERHAGGRRALSALYKTLGRSSEAAQELVQAAEILIADNEADAGGELLEKAVELDADNAAAQKLLKRLRPQAAPEPEPQKQTPAAIAASVPSRQTAASSEEDSEIAEAVAEIDVLVKYGLATKAVEQLETLAKKFPSSVQVRLKLRDLYGDLGNMGKAASHMAVLADLYAKQGRQDLANQAVEAASAMDPAGADVGARLGQPAAQAEIELEQPVLDEMVVPEAPAPVSGEISFEPPPDLGSEAPAPVSGEISFEPPPDLGSEAPAPISGEISFEPPPDLGSEAPAPVSGEITLEPPDLGSDLAFPGEAGFPGEEAPAPQPAEEPAFAQPFSAPDIPGEQFTDVSLPEAVPAAPPAEAVDLRELLAEAEFYYQQGLFDEARKHYEKALEVDPDNRQATARIAEMNKGQEEVEEFSRLAEAVDGLEGMTSFQQASGEAEITTPSDEEAVRSLMQEISELKQKSTPPPKDRPFTKSPAEEVFAGGPGPAPDEDFFDLGTELNDLNGDAPLPAARAARAAAADDFFDLASELRDELSAVAPQLSLDAPAEDQSLDDIFEDFKKGVEQQAVKEDVDTHYNLGVAYKEMGLLDDAIGEFILTPEDEPKYIQSRYMLGLCYMEQGDYQNAITEIGRAIIFSEQGDIPEQDRLSMSYDLGLAYQGAGNNENALKEFNEVYSLDPHYRDIASKIQEVQQGGQISMERLKDDIEKEISSKFLMEGERIQREEKTRKKGSPTTI